MNPEAEQIEHLDFQPSCQIWRLDLPGYSCPTAPIALVEWHKVGYCKSGCNEFGNMCGFVCLDHLRLLTQESQDLITNSFARIAPRFVHYTVLRCHTCGLEIRSVTDILQKVVML